MANKMRVWISVLVLIIVVLLAVLAYTLLVRPAVTGYSVNRQVEGYNACLIDVVSQVQQNGFVQIPIGNQTLVLVPYVPPEQQVPGVQ